MNPYFSVWFNTRKTIEEKLQTDWFHYHGMIPFLLFGINHSLLGDHRTDLTSLDVHPGINLAFIVALGALGGLLMKFIYSNLLFYIGKLWKGTASKTEISTIVSLALIPEVVLFLYLIITLVIHAGNVSMLKGNNVLSLISYFFGLKTLIIGLSISQNFSYGKAILNIFFPQIIIAIIYLILR